jgi:hypothetical protein
MFVQLEGEATPSAVRLCILGGADQAFFEAMQQALVEGSMRQPINDVAVRVARACARRVGGTSADDAAVVTPRTHCRLPPCRSRTASRCWAASTGAVPT